MRRYDRGTAAVGKEACTRISLVELFVQKYVYDFIIAQLLV